MIHVFSCIMANYRKAHHLPIHVLEQGGLYGSFIQDGPHVRFLSNQEIYMMMGALHEGNFPISDMALTHILGNCISVPHACIALLNAIKIIDQSSSISIPGLFIEITSMRLKAEAIYTVQDESGFMIRSHTNIQMIIDPTQSHPVFVTITIKTPTTMIQFFVRSGLRIKSVVTMLMGPSTPKELMDCVAKWRKNTFEPERYRRRLSHCSVGQHPQYFVNCRRKPANIQNAFCDCFDSRRPNCIVSYWGTTGIPSQRNDLCFFSPSWLMIIFRSWMHSESHWKNKVIALTWFFVCIGLLLLSTGMKPFVAFVFRWTKIIWDCEQIGN